MPLRLPGELTWHADPSRCRVAPEVLMGGHNCTSAVDL